MSNAVDRGGEPNRGACDELSTRPRRRWPWFLVAFVSSTLAACAGVPSSVSDASVGDGGSEGSPSTDGSPAEAGCIGAAQCSDGIDCTDDTCVAGQCVHTPVPARCMAGASCDLRMGCHAGRACGTAMDCADTDPCTVNERCDSVSRTCLFDLLDGDHDGFPPLVCGGGDCDDSNSNIHPGARERCNGVDDNCNGQIDDSADSDCNTGDVCRAGRCQFSGCTDPRLMLCGDRACVDVQTDSNYCGSCDRYCVARGTMGPCVGGQCQCAPNESRCDTRDPPSLGGRLNTSCVDLQTNDFSCGTCGLVCPMGTHCIAGACSCGAGQALCGGSCLDTQSDPANCGMCGHTCASGRCSGGACATTTCGTGMSSCGGMCIPTATDTMNCGGCGVRCGSGGNCVGGLCQYPSCVSAGMASCSGMTVCVYQDPRNCGTCGHSCMAGQSCTRGTCL